MDLRHRDELGWLSRVLVEFQAVVPAENMLLVGAMARDLLLHYAWGIPIARASRDVDLAVSIDQWAAYSEIRESLIETGNFSGVEGVPHRLVHHSGIPLDMVPFGGIADERGQIAWPGRGKGEMTVLGFREGRDSAVRVQLPGDVCVPVVSLPMFVVLKLLAWSERRLSRPGVDAADLYLVLRTYERAGNEGRLFDEHDDLLEQNGFDHQVAYAQILGRDMQAKLRQFGSRPEPLLVRLRRVLETETNPDGQVLLSAQGAGERAEHMRQLLSGLLAGLDRE